jgi:4-amino-4-deoxy-L-arabinose transferase-like glycosyltransferase
LFGGFIGLGLLSKYNFAVFIAGLAVASLLVAEHRRVVWNHKLWITAAVALLCFLPHGYWLITNVDAATAGTLQKLQEDYGSGYLRNVASGFGSMLVSLLTAVLVPALVYGVICRSYWKSASLELRNPDARLLLWLYVTVLMLIAGLLLTGEISHMKARWILPLLTSLPLAVFLFWPALQREEIYRGIAFAAAAAAVTVLLGLQLRVYLKPALGSYSAPHYPYSALSEELKRRFPDAQLIAGDLRDAGNLHFQEPARRPLIFDQVMSEHAVLNGKVLLIFQEDMRPD